MFHHTMHPWRVLLLLLACTPAPTAAASPPPSSCHTVHRPNLYVGTKTCSPLPISTGLMWFAHGDVSKIRHTAEMNDNLKKWGWSAHNGDDFGRHSLLDPLAQIHLITEYTADKDDANSWTMRVSGNLTSRGRKSKSKQERNDISVVFYVTNADPSGSIALHTAATAHGPSATISGSTQKEGSFSFEIARTQSFILDSKHIFIFCNSQESNCFPKWQS